MDVKTNRLRQLLAEEFELFGRFGLLLREEREALASQDNVALERLVASKDKLYQRLAELSAMRQSELGTSEPEASRQKLLALDSQLAHEWDKLLQLVREAHELNLINGKIIELQLNQNRQAVNLLKAAQDASALYTAAGQPQSPASGRDLGKV